MDGFSVALNVFDVNNQNIKNILLKTGEQVKLIIPKNAPYGYWNITAESEKIKTNKVFHVNKSGFYHVVSPIAKENRSYWWGIHLENKQKFIQKWAKSIDKGMI